MISAQLLEEKVPMPSCSLLLHGVSWVMGRGGEEGGMQERKMGKFSKTQEEW